MVVYSTVELTFGSGEGRPTSRLRSSLVHGPRVWPQPVRTY